MKVQLKFVARDFGVSVIVGLPPFPSTSSWVVFTAANGVMPAKKI